MSSGKKFFARHLAPLAVEQQPIESSKAHAGRSACSDWTRFHWLLSLWASTSLRPHHTRPIAVAFKLPSHFSALGTTAVTAVFFALTKHSPRPKQQRSLL